MSLLFALALAAQGYDPEIEAVMGHRKPPAERRTDRAASHREFAVPPDMQKKFDACLSTALDDPDKGIAAANEWRIAGGRYYARQCLGFAYAKAARWAPAATAFEQAANDAEVAGDPASGRIWAQAGNAALAGGDAAKARAYLNSAIARGLPDGLARGEAYLDRARALVALNLPVPARADLDDALAQAPQDPLAWLLSATLARRMDDLPLAQKHIAQAVKLSPDDASVALEEGNIAILSGQEDAARTAWQRAVKIAPDSDAGKAAADDLSRLAAAPK